VQKLAGIAEGLNRAISENPREVFLIEGHTDAVGPDVDNLSLSDRRADIDRDRTDAAIRRARVKICPRKGTASNISRSRPMDRSG
jgi:hypothetical protein